LLLKNEIVIDCETRDIFHWFSRFCEYYLQWHPDHIACNYIKGEPFNEGSIMYCQEYLHGRPHKFRMQLTRIVPDQRVDYSIGPGMSGAFIVEPEKGGVLFIAELRLGFKPALLGRALDAMLRRSVGWKIEALQQHMAEEGQNLKALIEAGFTVPVLDAEESEDRQLELALDSQGQQV
jgi:hypothetical protein